MPEVTARYDYVDEHGALLQQTERISPKGFRARRPDPEREGQWIYNLDGVRRVLYRLPKVLAAIRLERWILVVEGEKDVHSLGRIGQVATTAAGGAGKWRAEYSESLRGAKVAIIADADEPGRKHALTVARALHGIAKKVRCYEPAPPHKDVSDHLDAGLTLADLIALSTPEPPAPAAAISVMSMAELLATPDPDERDYLLGPLMMKGARIVIAAHSGHGKTTLGIRALAAILRGEEFLAWHGSGNGARALVLDVEQGRRTVKRRFIEAGLHEMPEKVQIVHQPDGLSLDSDARQVDALEAIFDEGRYDVVLADPLYKMHRGDPNDERKAVDLMRRFDAWRERYGFALVLPMHCRKPQAGSKFSMHDISGSGAFVFGAEVIIGLQRVSRGYSFLYWWKDREGDLGCLHERWGLMFDVERGFRRDPKDLDRTPVRDQVRQALEDTPEMTIDALRMVVDAKQGTIRRALEDIGALHDGARLVADRCWSLPPTLFAAHAPSADSP